MAASLATFWFAALLNVMGPFVAYYYSAGWPAYLYLLGFWQGFLQLPFPVYEPSFGFDLVVLDGFLVATLCWYLRTGSLGRMVTFMATNLFVFEMVIAMVIPGEMFDHVIYGVEFIQLGHLPLVNNMLVLGVSSSILVAKFWKG